MNADQLKKLVGPADELQAEVRSGTAKMRPESEQAARDLGKEWATSAALSQITAAWDTQLNKVAGQIGEIGPKLLATANNHLLAETVARRAVQATRRAAEVLGG
ncbi:hypothetical protein [Thermomonospora amylolytica]|uniref:hypothetical protein n=1 Tax=Thermomonospora amylolytica TaxID=1411117 RepID=UPI000E6D333A|nr:hypothetical protein [Thermomonospora amylolytica]